MEHKIIVDSRESRSTIIEALRGISGLDVEVAELDTGDYILRDDTVVERKSASDFVMSIQDSRLFEQVGKMKMSFTRQIILIEGDVYTQRSLMKPEAIGGAISYLIALQDVSVVSTKNAQESANLLVAMSKHLHFGLPAQPVLRPAKPKPNLQAVHYVLQGLPGVGHKYSVALAEHFGTIHKVMDASIDELCECKGIGRKTAERIYEIAHWSQLNEV
ncbi:ERCC4 domain-containing protein [Herbaspirillum sp. RV1423]|uniref:ERCC4 domain-containing protein n=1 Tax=Herbaspirillum sp. RV1423 TaxID=1443993 RepID=UPI0004B73A07|nr:ERCC4 domain-containing protein [Herbaspirillum sp. RV1423]